MGKDAKKAVVSDEWRNKNVEERLEFSLIKVCNTDSEMPCYKDILCVILRFWSLILFILCTCIHSTHTMVFLISASNFYQISHLFEFFSMKTKILIH